MKRKLSVAALLTFRLVWYVVGSVNNIILYYLAYFVSRWTTTPLVHRILDILILYLRVQHIINRLFHLIGTDLSESYCCLEMCLCTETLFKHDNICAGIWEYISGFIRMGAP